MVVAIAEMGDKTQLLSFLLAARLMRDTPVVRAGRYSRCPMDS
jgi:putative Ca2+/H+ antiporter (TMEM165/GDT1 family)